MHKNRIHLLVALCILSLCALIIAARNPMPIETGVRDIEGSDPSNRRVLTSFSAADGSSRYYQIVETHTGTVYQIQPADSSKPEFLPTNKTVIYESPSMDEPYVEEMILNYVENGTPKAIKQYHIYAPA